MNDGVKLLLERIKTNPEEFTEGSKWGHLINSHKMFLSEEDCRVLEDALNGLMQQRFTERVMKELLAPEEDDGLGKWYTKQAVGTASGGVTLGQFTTTPYSTSTGTITLEGAEHMKAHLKALKQEYADVFEKPKEQKKHKTIFGKLFNYQ